MLSEDKVRSKPQWENEIQRCLHDNEKVKSLKQVTLHYSKESLEKDGIFEASDRAYVVQCISGMKT